MRLLPLITALAGLPACTMVTLDEYAAGLDPDADGVPWPDDCDNTDPEVLDPAGTIRFVDGDGDGEAAFDAEPVPLSSCAGWEDYVPYRRDCDDGDATISSGAPEVCDGKDNDCNGRTDDGPDCRPLDDLSVTEALAARATTPGRASRASATWTETGTTR